MELKLWLYLLLTFLGSNNLVSSRMLPKPTLHDVIGVVIVGYFVGCTTEEK